MIALSFVLYFMLNILHLEKKSVETLRMRAITNQIILLNYFAIYCFIDYTVKFYVQNFTFQ